MKGHLFRSIILRTRELIRQFGKMCHLGGDGTEFTMKSKEGESKDNMLSDESLENFIGENVCLATLQIPLQLNAPL